MDFLISTGVFGLIIVLALVFLTARTRGERTQALLDDVTRPRGDEEVDTLLRIDRRRKSKGEAFGAVYHFRPLQQLEESMWQAGVYMRLSEMLLVMVLLLGAGIMIGELVWGDQLFALGLGAAFCALPIVYIRFRRGRRIRAFSQQLPFALDLIKSSLEAGHSLLRGLQVMVQEFSDPIGGEFRTVLEQTRLGMPLPRAFEELLKRVPEEDLRLLVVAIKVQSEIGSSLAQIVGRLSEIVRTRQRLQAQIRAMTAQSRMSGMIVGVLPLVVLGAFSLVQPNYTHILFHDPMGLKVLKAAIVLDAMAFISIRRILKVNY